MSFGVTATRDERTRFLSRLSCGTSPVMIQSAVPFGAPIPDSSRGSWVTYERLNADGRTPWPADLEALRVEQDIPVPEPDPGEFRSLRPAVDGPRFPCLHRLAVGPQGVWLRIVAEMHQGAHRSRRGGESGSSKRTVGDLRRFTERGRGEVHVSGQADRRWCHRRRCSPVSGEW